MANQEQLRILKQGVEAWNEYRKSHRHININLGGANLKGQNLSGADLSEADIRRTNFTDANLRGANFTNVKCGLQRCWATLLVILCWLTTGLVVTVVAVAGVAVLGINRPISGAIYGLLVGALLVIVAAATGIAVEVAGAVGIPSLAAAVVITVVAAVITKGIVLLPVLLSITTLISFLGHPIGIFENPKTQKGLIARVRVGIVGIGVLAVFIAAMVLGVELFPETQHTLTKALVKYATKVELETFHKILLMASVGMAVAPAILATLGAKEFDNSFAINFATKVGTSFNGADLTDAKFTGARLKSTDLRQANLTRVCWYGTKMLDNARLGDSYLKDTQLRQWLIGKGTNQNFNGKSLQGVNLKRANLTDASFIEADLSEANLQYADLSRAKLIKTQLDDTNLTGACIEDWNINIETNLEGVICDYIYLKQGQQERRPSNPNRNFKPGEFAKLVKKSVETVDLIFKKGVDWRAVAYSIKNTQVLNENTPIAIQSIENRGDGVVLIKVNVAQNADKGKIESDFWKGYEFANKTLKEQYEVRLLDKDKEINRLFTIVTQGKEVQKLMAEQPKFQQNFYAPVYGNAQNVEGNQNIYASEQKQTLAEAADEIQKLLQQLKQNNPDATEEEQIKHLNDETTPSFKRKAFKALKAAGETAIEEFLDNPYVNVGKAAINGWMEPD